MYAREIAVDAVNDALEARGFHWPKPKAKDKDTVLARLMAFDALYQLTGLSVCSIAQEVGTTPSNGKSLVARRTHARSGLPRYAIWSAERWVPSESTIRPGHHAGIDPRVVA
jgi:hypothetical protein